jgi:hypothetical protein
MRKMGNRPTCSNIVMGGKPGKTLLDSHVEVGALNENGC